MTTIHLHVPAAPRVAACGDAAATKFTPWRWKCTCSPCKTITAARVMDTQGSQDILYRTDLPVRFNKLVALIRGNGQANSEESIAEFERDRQKAAICNKHGLLTDPIALLDAKNNRMVFACPECVNDPKLQARWEAEK
jgi:hypothetical protein